MAIPLVDRLLKKMTLMPNLQNVQQKFTQMKYKNNNPNRFPKGN